MENTEKQFLEELDIKPNILEEPLTEEKLPVEEEKTEEEETPKNRREKRLHERYEQRGEEVKKLADEVISLRNVVEAKTARETTEEAEYTKLVERIYGDATPEAKEATELLKQALKGVHESAKKEALQEAVKTFEAERQSEARELKQEEDRLEEIMDSLEDEYDADFSNETLRKGFLEFLEKISPKDKEGNIIEYADPNTTYELFESRREKSSNRAKELASRSMTHSGASQESKLEQNSAERFLRENGII